MDIHLQNCDMRGGYSALPLDKRFAQMCYEEAIRECPDALVVDVRAMMCGL